MFSLYCDLMTEIHFLSQNKAVFENLKSTISNYKFYERFM